MSSSVTPSSPATAGSTLRGTPRSITSRGPVTPSKSAASSTWDSAATAVRTTSASASSPATRSSGAARISNGPAAVWRTRSRARAAERLTTTTRSGRVGRRDVRQGAAHAEAHVARADDDDAGAAQPGLVLAAGDRHRGVGERRRPLADAGLGAHPLARLQRVPEERREDGPRRALLLGPLEGPPDLAHHLGLPGHHRLEARGHREEVGGDVVVEADGGVGGELLHREARMLGEDVVDLRHGVVEAVHHRVDLGAQAGREDHGLLDVAAVAQRAERLVQVGVGDGRGLEQRQRGLRVLEPYDDDGHSVPSWVGSQLCRSRPSACQSPAGPRAVSPARTAAESPTARIIGARPPSRPGSPSRAR